MESAAVHRHAGIQMQRKHTSKTPKHQNKQVKRWIDWCLHCPHLSVFVSVSASSSWSSEWLKRPDDDSSHEDRQTPVRKNTSSLPSALNTAAELQHRQKDQANVVQQANTRPQEQHIERLMTKFRDALKQRASTRGHQHVRAEAVDAAEAYQQEIIQNMQQSSISMRSVAFLAHSLTTARRQQSLPAFNEDYGGLWDALLQVILQGRLQGASVQDVARILPAVSRLRTTREQRTAVFNATSVVLRQLGTQAWTHPGLTGIDISMIMWAHGNAQYRYNSEILAAGLRAAAQAGKFSRETAATYSNVLHGAAKLGIRYSHAPDAWDACIQGIYSHLEQYVTQSAYGGGQQYSQVKAVEVSNTIWACAKSGQPIDSQNKQIRQLLDVTCKAVMAGVMRGAEPQAWSSLLLALAKVGMPVEDTLPIWDNGLRALTSYLDRHVHPRHGAPERACRLNAQVVANTVWAVHEVGLHDRTDAMMQFVANAVQLGIMRDGGHQAWPSIIWCLANMPGQESPHMQTVWDGALEDLAWLFTAGKADALAVSLAFGAAVKVNYVSSYRPWIRSVANGLRTGYFAGELSDSTYALAGTILTSLVQMKPKLKTQVDLNSLEAVRDACIQQMLWAAGQWESLKPNQIERFRQADVALDALGAPQPRIKALLAKSVQLHEP